MMFVSGNDDDEVSMQIFLSYHILSKALIKKLYEILKKEGYRIWLDLEHIRVGDNSKKKIAAALLASDLVICFMTKKYCETKNCMVEFELVSAHNKPVIYVMLDDLCKDEYKKNRDVNAVKLRLVDKLQLCAFAAPNTFEPWSDALYAQLLRTIESFKKVEVIDFAALKAPGMLFVSGSERSLKVWTTKEYRCVKNIKFAHDSYISCLIELTSDLFASGSADCTIKIWSRDEFLCEKTIKNAHESEIYSMLKLPELLFASGARDDSIKIWSMTDYSCAKHIIKADKNTISTLVMISNDGYFASGSASCSIKVWRVQDFECVQHINNAHYAAVSCFAMIKNDHLVSGSYDKSLKIWSTSTGGVLKCVEHITNAHEHYIHSLCNLPNGLFASSSWDKSIKVWSMSKCVGHLRDCHSRGIYSLVALPNMLFASGGDDNAIKVWDASDCVLMKHVAKAQDGSIRCFILFTK